MYIVYLSKVFQTPMFVKFMKNIFQLQIEDNDNKNNELHVPQVFEDIPLIQNIFSLSIHVAHNVPHARKPKKTR